MNTKTTLSISEARKRIFDIADDVQRPGVRYTFTDRGKPKAVLMSAEDFESLEETLEVLRIFPNLDQDIDEVHRDIKTGAYKKYITLEELLAKDGFVLAEKSKKGYGLHREVKTNGRKTSS